MLMEELVESVTVLPSHFEISVYDAPALNVLPVKAGMLQAGFVGVGDPTRQRCYLALAARPNRVGSC